MFGFFTPKCPVDDNTKAWIETGLVCLVEEFGMERLLRSEMVMIDDLLPESFDSTEESVRNLTDELCRKLQINPNEIELKFVSEEELSGANSLYKQQPEGAVIHLAKDQTEDAGRLIEILCSDLCHHIILEGERNHPVPFDSARLSELLMAMLGFGEICANSDLSPSSPMMANTDTTKKTIKRSVTLTPHNYGYALALCAWIRNDEIRDWSHLLGLDAESSLKQGVKFLQKTDDVLIQREKTVELIKHSDHELLRNLQEKSDSLKIATIWELQHRLLATPECISASLLAMKDPNFLVRLEAVTLLGIIKIDSGDITSALLHALEDRRSEVRASAVKTIGEIRCNSEKVVPALCEMLEDEDRLVVNNTVIVLSKFGPLADHELRQVLHVLNQALVQCDYNLSDRALFTLTKICDDPAVALDQYYEERDEELHRMALDALQALMQAIHESEETTAAS
ncbi:MAG: hypothetical protein COA78_08265 [Blastopirellula sp.]|nr:MAG: hypothetical protein COA78_08265 [Blastopirellula sp.]